MARSMVLSPGSFQVCSWMRAMFRSCRTMPAASSAAFMTSSAISCRWGGRAAGALPQAEALVIDCIRARADRDQNLVRFVPAGDHPGRAGDQVNGLTEQLIDELAGVGLGREAPRQTQQRFAATVQDRDTLGG